MNSFQFLKYLERCIETNSWDYKWRPSKYWICWSSRSHTFGCVISSGLLTIWTTLYFIILTVGCKLHIVEKSSRKRRSLFKCHCSSLQVKFKILSLTIHSYGKIKCQIIITEKLRLLEWETLQKTVQNILNIVNTTSELKKLSKKLSFARNQQMW